MTVRLYGYARDCTGTNSNIGFVEDDKNGIRHSAIFGDGMMLMWDWWQIVVFYVNNSSKFLGIPHQILKVGTFSIHFIIFTRFSSG